MAEREFCTVVKGGKTELKANRNLAGDDFVLKNICGVSCASTHALAANPQDGTIAFAATSILVFLDPRYSKQTFLENPSGRSIRAVAFSDDAKYVAIGETGYNPNICVYNNADHRLLCAIELKKMCTVKALEFHPRSIYLAVACANSYNIGLFDLKGRKLAWATFVVEPLGMTLPKVGSYLVVCGHRKLSLFSLTEVDTNLDMQMYPTNIVFDRRSVLLGYQSDYTFVDVTSGVGPHERRVYTVTSCGYLCDLKVGDIFIDRAYKIDMQCFCVKYCFGCIFVGCAKNTINICSPVNLSVITTIHDREAFSPLHAQPSIWKFEADAVSIAANRTTRIVTCIFSDHHRHSWQVSLIKDSLECNAIIPVDADGNKVSWQPTSYEMQSKVGNVLSYYGSQKAKTSSKEGGERFGGLPDAFKLAGPGFKPPVRPSAIPCYVNATRFTPDGKEIICGNAEGEIKIFDAVTGRLNKVIEAHSSNVTHIELLFDDQFQLVASGGRDRVIFILDAEKGYGLVQVLCDHSSAIVSISMANYSEILTLVSSAADGVILIRRAIKGRQLRFVIIGELSEFGGKPRMYAHGNDFIITGGDNGHINLFQTDPFISTKPTKTIKSVACAKGKRYMKAVALDPSGCYIVTNSTTGILVFNIHTGKHVATLSKMKDVSLAAFTNDCEYLICESNDGCRFQWQLPRRMTEVMRAKLGDQNCVQREIPYQKILSRMNLKETASSTNVETTTVQNPPADKQNVRDAVQVSKLCLEDVKTIGSFLQKSPSECDSYSTCNSSSRSYTDLGDFSRQKSDFQSSENGQQAMGISDEARRLLFYKNTSSESSTYTSGDKTAEIYTSTRNSTDKRRMLTTTPQSSELEEARALYLSQDSDKFAHETKTRAWKPLSGNLTKTSKGVLTNNKRNSHRTKDSLGPHLRNGDQISTSNPDETLDDVYKPNKPKHSPMSEYLSAGSEEESIRDVNYYSDGLDPDQQTLNTDSKTIPPSDLVSEMHEFFLPATNAIEMSTDGSLSVEADPPDPVLYSDRHLKGLDASPRFNRRNIMSPVESVERYARVMSEKEAKNNWRDDSPERSLRKKEHFSPEKEAESPAATFKQRMELFKARMQARLGKTENETTLINNGEHDGKKEISGEIEETKENENDREDFQPYQCNNNPQNINQNTDATVEYDNIMDMCNTFSKHCDECFAEDPLDMKVEICLGREGTENSKEMAVKSIKMSEEEIVFGDVPSEPTRQLTPLSNTQETFFNFQSELLDNDFIQDLAPADSMHWRPPKRWKWKTNETRPLISDGGEIGHQHNRIRHKGFGQNASEEKKEDERPITCVDRESTKINPYPKVEKTGGECVHLSAVEIKDLIDIDTRDRKSAELSQNPPDNHLSAEINWVKENDTKGRGNSDFSEKCENKKDDAEMQRFPLANKESEQCHPGEVCQKAESAVTEIFLEGESATAEIEFHDQEKRRSCSDMRHTVCSVVSDGIPQECFTKDEEKGEKEEEEEGKVEENGEKGAEVEEEGLYQCEGADLRPDAKDVVESVTPSSNANFQDGVKDQGTMRGNTELLCSAAPAGTSPFSPNLSGRLSPQSVVIEGLGSVANLYRNQDDYVRRLREVRRNLEKSIKALKVDKKKQHPRSQKQAKDE